MTVIRSASSDAPCCSPSLSAAAAGALAAGAAAQPFKCGARQQGRAALLVVHASKGFGGFGAKKDAVSKLCPCGSGQDYQACCQRYHQSVTLKAPTAEATLRARFSAYARKEWKYIVRTTHPDNANTKGSSAEGGKVRTTFEEDIKVTMYNFEFAKLAVLGIQEGAGAGEQVIDCEVQVVQRMDDKGKKLSKGLPRTIREKALFVQSDGAWEFLRALDSNWSRDKLDYVEAAAVVAQPAAAS